MIMAGAVAQAETITLGETEYTIDRLIEREVGPGVHYTRMRIPDYPLNVNVLTVDLTNPYNRIETSVGREASRGTELLVDAAARQSYEGHRALAGANANFWYVGTQTQGPVFQGISIGASVRNGKIITETNQHRDQFDMGSLSTGIVGIDYEKVLHIAPVTSSITITSDQFGPTMVHQCNKGVWEDELSMYNSHYGADNKFQPLTWHDNKYAVAKGLTDVTEVILDFDEGQQWKTATDLGFVVREVRTATDGLGTLGEHDLALVGRGDNSALLARLKAGDKLTLNYSWTFDPGTDLEVTPSIENAVGGNAIVMYHGELRSENWTHGYCSMVYSRTGYGCSQDGKTLYIVVIDKSIDPVYRTSAGCTTAEMCLIAKHLGCWNMANLDAGGSAQMFVTDRIVNKTTEGHPRQVNNGWFVYSTAPEDDNTVARLEFYEYSLRQAVYSSASPAVIAYNKYGAVIDYDYKDVTYSVSEGGRCEGNVFIAGATPCTAVLTAHCGDVSVSKDIRIIDAEVRMRNANILIDSHREYPVEVNAVTDEGVFSYDPAHIDWTVDDTEIAIIDDKGVLHGLRNGTTRIAGTIGGVEVTSEVTVEIPSSGDLALCPNSLWKVKGSTGMSNVGIADDGTVSFTFGNRTAGSLDFTNDKTAFYSLPDEVYIEFNSEVPVQSLTVDIIPANATKAVSVKYSLKEPYAAGETHRVEMGLDTIFDLNDMAVFPLKFSRLRCTFQTLDTNKGDKKLAFGGVHAVYKNYDSVEDITVVADDARLMLSANPASAGQSVAVKAPGVTAVEIYSVSGALVGRFDCDPSETAFIEAPASGTYVVRAMTATGVRAAIMIVK